MKLKTRVGFGAEKNPGLADLLQQVYVSPEAVLKMLKQFRKEDKLREVLPELNEIWDKGNKIKHDDNNSLIEHIFTTIDAPSEVIRIWFNNNISDYNFEVLPTLLITALFHDLGMLYTYKDTAKKKSSRDSNEEINDDKKMYAKSLQILKRYKDNILPEEYARVQNIIKYLHLDITLLTEEEINNIRRDIGDEIFGLLCMFEAANKVAELYGRTNVKDSNITIKYEKNSKEQRTSLIAEYIIKFGSNSTMWYRLVRIVAKVISNKKK